MGAQRQRGADLAVAALKYLIAEQWPCRIATMAEALAAPRSSLYRVLAALARWRVVETKPRGFAALGPVAKRLALKRDEALREEDAGRRAPRPKAWRRPGGALGVDPSALTAVDCASFRRAPKFRIGFANAAIDNPWRIALVHSVEYGAVKHAGLVSRLEVRHAGERAERQAADIEALVAGGAQGLIVSAIAGEPIEAALREALRKGVPAVLVDRGLPEKIPHVSFVTCDDRIIGETTALWLAERLEGHGGIVLLPGLADAEPAQRRLAGACAVFARFPGLQALTTEWTSWSGAKAQRIMKRCLEAFGDRIDGVWCDSGLQGVGSLKAFLRAKRFAGRIPPHTGGDLNLAYKLAIRHKAPLAAVDYPPAMGLRAVEALLDVLRGRDVPRRIDVATEIVVTRGCATASVRPDLWADEHVRWDLPDDLILASGLGVSYDPRRFRIRYRGNRYNRSAAVQAAAP